MELVHEVWEIVHEVWLIVHTRAIIRLVRILKVRTHYVVKGYGKCDLVKCYRRGCTQPRPIRQLPHLHYGNDGWNSTATPSGAAGSDPSKSKKSVCCGVVCGPSSEHATFPGTLRVHLGNGPFPRRVCALPMKGPLTEFFRFGPNPPSLGSGPQHSALFPRLCYRFSV